MNLDTAITQQLTNMVGQTGPWGSTTYSPTGSASFVNSQGRTVEIPQFTQTTQYNPAQQAIFDKTTQAQTNIADIASQQSASLRDYLNTAFNFDNGSTFNPSSVPTADPFSYNNQDAEKWAYDLGQQRIAPQQQQDRSALETQLVNKGIRPGTAAWNSELERLGRTQNDQNNQLALTGRQQGFNEALTGWQGNTNTALAAQQQAYTQALGGRQQNFQEAVTGRNQPLNEIASLLSGSQIANPNTGFSATPQATVGGVDYTGLVNQQYQTQAANAGGALGGLFGLAGTLGSAGIKAGMFSDRRLKTDIRRVGTLKNGLPVYSFRYVAGGPMQIGLMSDDVREVMPEAVMVHESGFDMVDYGRAAA